MSRSRLIPILLAILTVSPALGALSGAAGAATPPRTPDAAPPEPFFFVEPGFGTTATAFTLDPRGSSVPVGTRIVVAWGDGSFSTGNRTAQGYAWDAGALAAEPTLTVGLETLQHRYHEAGDMHVTLLLDHPTLGSATAYALVRVAGLEPAAVTRQEGERLETLEVTPNNAVEVVQQAPFSVPGPGTLVVLAAGLDPSFLPALDRLDLTYATCTPAGCAALPIEQAADPEGGATSAFTVVLQKALNGTFHVLDVADAEGRVTLAALTHALRYADDVDASVVLSLLPPDAGFAHALDAGPARDPYGVVALPGEQHDHAHDHGAMGAFWMGVGSHLARYDLGGDGHAYPPPNGFNDSAPLPGAHGGHGGGSGAYGGHDHGAGASGELYGPGTGADACYPVPPSGPRVGPLMQRLQRYAVFEPGVKLLQALTPGDLSILPRVEQAAVDEHAHHLLDLACLDVALSELAHRGIPVVVPAGDGASHSGVIDPATATWTLQTVADLAARPQVIAVGATTSAEVEAPPTYGTRRVMLPMSAAGPAPSLYGVKPDLVAPGDVPVPLVGQMASYGGNSEPQRFNLHERFAYNETRGTLRGDAADTRIEDERLHVGGGPTPAGIVFTSLREVPPLPTLNATLRVKPVANAATNWFTLALQNGDAPHPLDGFGVELRAVSGGKVRVETRVWDANGQDVCGLTCSGTSAEFPQGADVQLNVSDAGVARPGFRLLKFDLHQVGSSVTTTIFREAAADSAQRVCRCRHLTFLSRATGGSVLSEATIDNVFVSGLVTPANTDYAPGIPLVGQPVVRPTTRVAAAYVAAVALVENHLASEGEGIHRLEHLRGRLASLSKPLANVPVAVQGAGELNLESQASSDVVVTLFEHVPHVGGVDYGLRKTAGVTATVTFESPTLAEIAWSNAQVVPVTSGLLWTRADHAGAITSVGGAAAPALSATVSGSGAVRTVVLELDAIPAEAGTYGTHVAFRVTLGGVASPLWRQYHLPVQVTVGFPMDLDVRGTGIPDGTQLWLTHPTGHPDGHDAHLVHDAWIAGPSANATVVDGVARFPLVADVHYALAAPLDASLPIPTTLGTREGGRPQGIHHLVASMRPKPAAHLWDLAPGATLPAPVSFRWLDLVGGESVARAAILPPATLEEGFRAPVALGEPPVWDHRGDHPRAAGRALDDPLPQGETPFGWSLRTIDVAPPFTLGGEEALLTRQRYAAHLDDAGAHRYAALSGHLDTRPYAAEGRNDLPWARASVTFPTVSPASEIHGHLLLPLELTEAVAVVRLSLAGRDHTYPITREGVWLPHSPAGLTWPYAKDRFDAIPDAREGGILTGFGHRHASERVGLAPAPRTPSGYLIPFSFHDLDGAPGDLTVTVLVKPDPSPRPATLAATAAGPAPGPRFRLDGAALHAWADGMAERAGDDVLGVDPGDLARFEDGGDADASRAPAIRPPPYRADADLLGEFLEAYVRGPAREPRLAVAGTGAFAPVPGVERAGAVPAGPTAAYPLGRALVPVESPSLHPVGVRLSYGALDQAIDAAYPGDFAFAGTGDSVWRLGLATLRAVAPGGAVDLRFDGAAASGAIAPVKEPFPDAVDADRAPNAFEDQCLLQPVGTLFVGRDARRACFETLRRADGSGFSVGGHAQAVGDEHGRTRDVGAPSGGSPQARPCVDGTERDHCGEDGLLDLIESVDGGLAARLREIVDLTLGSGSGQAAGDAILLHQGVIPGHGALLLLRHQVDALANATDARGVVEVEIHGRTHALVTLEGDEALRADDAAARDSGERYDVYDLDQLAGQFVTLRARPHNATWTLAWRLAQRAADDPLPRLDDARYVQRDAPGTPLPTLHAAPAGDAVTAGPAQLARAEDAANDRVNLPRGLDVPRDATIAGKHLVVGTDVGQPALVTVRSGATLTLDGVLVSPRGPRSAYGFLVEPGATLVLKNVTLLRAGSGATGDAALDVRGTAILTDARVLSGAVGVRLREGATLEAERLTLARLATGLLVDGGRARLRDSFVDGNLVGVLARNATLDVDATAFTSNRDGGIVAQDSLVAVTGSLFAWNGDAGPGAALATLEGLDNGRAVVHDARFLRNARAVLARAPLDLHAVTIAQTGGEALRVAPAATLRVATPSVSVADGAAVRLDAGAPLDARLGALSGAPAIRCAASGRPAAILTQGTGVDGGVEPACGPLTLVEGGSAPGGAWRDVVARAFVPAGENPAIALPRGATPQLTDLLGGGGSVAYADGKLVVTGEDRLLRLVAHDGSAAGPARDAWATDVVVDSVAPLVTDARLDVPLLRGFTPGASIPVRLVSDEIPAATSIFVNLTSADGRAWSNVTRAVDGLRGLLAIAGRGAAGALSAQTGENLTLIPQVRDRAGNVGWGKAVSVVIDRTPPRAWIHAANPCGSLLGHDLHWRAHDPETGSGLPRVDDENPVAYVVYVATLNLTDVLGLDVGLLKDAFRLANPQELIARDLTRVDAVLPTLTDLVDPWNQLPLWVEIGRFNRTVERFDYRPIQLPDLPGANPGLDNLTLERVINLTRDVRENLTQRAKDLDDGLLKLPNATPLPANVWDLVNQSADNLEKLNPFVLAVKVDAYDAVGNKGVAIEPVLADALAPTPLLYLIGDALRERFLPLVLGASARVNLTDLHGEIALFDPDCGLEEVQVNSSPVGQPLAPLVTLHPRDGRVQFDLRELASYYPPTECGYRQYTMDARDEFGRTTRLQGALLLDRLAPTTLVTNAEAELPVQDLGVILGVLPDVTVRPKVWLGQGDLLVDAHVASRNLGACPSAAVHDVKVQARLMGGEWITVNATHYGSLQHAGELPNTTVDFNASLEIRTGDLGVDDVSLSGHPLEFRVYSSDEGGNVDADVGVDFSLKLDRVAPLCRAEPLAVGGFDVRVNVSVNDSAQGAEGNVSAAWLLFRPATLSPGSVFAQGDWGYYGALPTSDGEFLVEMADRSLADGLPVDAPFAVEFACAVWDEAGNGRIMGVVNATLDLAPPSILILPEPPAWSNGPSTVGWTVANATSVNVREHRAGDRSVGRDLSAEHAAQAIFLQSLAATEDGKEWVLNVSAVDEAGNHIWGTARTGVDLVAPSLRLANLGDLLVPGGFLPPEHFAFPVDWTDEGNPQRSPVTIDPNFTAGSAAGVVTYDEAQNRFVMTFGASGGDYVLTADVWDQAGNKQSPTASQAFKVDTLAPLTRLEGIDGPDNRVSIRLNGTEKVHVHWVGRDSWANFSVEDEYLNPLPQPGSGVEDLVLRARRLAGATLLPVGDAFDVPVVLVGEADGVKRYRADLDRPEFQNNTLYRFEPSARDRVGNVEVGVIGGQVFAFDVLAPHAVLSALPEYVNVPNQLDPAVRIYLNGSHNDTGGDVDSGVAELHVRIVRTPGSESVEIHGNVGNLTTGTFSLDAWLRREDDGVRHGICVQAVDLAGNVGPCSNAETILLDATAPVSRVLRPVDALLDDYTKELPLEVDVLAENAAPEGRFASPLGKLFLEVETNLRRDLKRFDLLGLDLVEGQNATFPVDLGGVDGTRYHLRTYVVDAAGNGAPGGSTNASHPNRLNGEWILLPFDGRDGWKDRSGNAQDAYGPNGTANPQGRASLFGQGYWFDGVDDRLTSKAVMGFGNSMTVMAWIKPELTGNRVILGDMGSSNAEWSLWLDASGRLTGKVRTSVSSLTLTGPALQPNEWRHVALTYQSGLVTLHLDGSPVASNNLVGDVVESNGFSIGRGILPSGSYGTFKGMIDEVRIHRDALPSGVVDEIRRLPYDLDPRAPDDKLLLDVTAPVALPNPGGLHVKDPYLPVVAADPSPGTPSNVSTTSLDVRVMDEEPHFGVVTGTRELVASLAPGAAAPSGTMTATRTLHLDPGFAPGPLGVRILVSDTIQKGARDCAGNLLDDKLSWSVRVNGTLVLTVDPADDGATPRVWTATTSLSSKIAGSATITLEAVVPSTVRLACAPAFEIRFDDLVLTDATGLRRLASDDFSSGAGWQLNAPAGLSIAQRGAPDPWRVDWSPTVGFNASWPAMSADGFAWNGAKDVKTVLQFHYGPNTTYALGMHHSSDAGTSPLNLVEIVDKALSGPAAPTRLRFWAKGDSYDNGLTNTIEARYGVRLQLDTGQSIVFLTYNDSYDAAPPANTHLVNLSAQPIPGWRFVDVDVAEHVARLGLAGNVVRAGLYFEKLGTATVQGKPYHGSYFIDDLRLGTGEDRLRVDLPFAFPLYGRTHHVAWADPHGVIGFSEGFDATYADETFLRQPVVAPAWGSFTTEGHDAAANRAHAVYVHNASRDHVTIAWTVANATNPASTNRFAATLHRTGEVEFHYGAVFDDETLVRRIGLSAGDGTRHLTHAEIPATLENFGLDVTTSGPWVPMPRQANGTYPLPLDAVVHVRAGATDLAGNEDPIHPEQPEAILHVDTLPPILHVAPIVDELLGGFANRTLWLDTTITDAGSGIDRDSITLELRDNLLGTTTRLQPMLGTHAGAHDALLTHRGNYTLTLAASDQAGNRNETSVTFDVRIKPEPTIELVRDLLGGTFVDDVLVGLGEGAGAAVGSSLSVKGKVTADGGDFAYALTLDGELLDAASDGVLNFSQILALDGLDDGLPHRLEIRAETAAGSFDVLAYDFTVEANLVVGASGESGDEGWTFSADAPDQAGWNASARRTGANGAQIVAKAGGNAPSASYEFPRALPVGRYWAFVHLNATPTGALDVLRLDTGAGTAFAARVGGDLRLELLHDGAWTATPLALEVGEWTKLEARDDGTRVDLYVDNRHAAVVPRAAPGTITTARFGAQTSETEGELWVDDVGAARGDLIARKIVQEGFDGSGDPWLGASNYLQVDPVKGSKAAHVNSSLAASEIYREFPAISPDYTVTLNVGAFHGGCAGVAGVLRMNDSAGDTVLGIRCNAGRFQAHADGAWVEVGASASDSAYTRLRIAVGRVSYTLFVDDVLAGVFNLSSTGPAGGIRLGGQGGYVWIDDVSVVRGRTPVIDGVETERGMDAWQRPTNTTTFSSAISSANSYTGAHSVWVSALGGLNEVSAVRREVDLPRRFVLSQAVYVPAGATFEEFYPLLLESENGPEIGIALRTNTVTGVTTVRYLGSGSTATVPGATISPGWHVFRMVVDVDKNEWTPYVDGADGGDYWIDDVDLVRLAIGDFRSDGAPNSGRGEVFVDDLVVLPQNRLPEVTIDNPPPTLVRGTPLTGTATDADTGDAPDAMYLWVDRSLLLPILNAPRWSFDTSTLPLGDHVLEVLAYEGAESGSSDTIRFTIVDP